MHIKVGAVLEGIRTLKDKSYKLTFETGELAPEVGAMLLAMVQTYGCLAYFSEDEEVVVPDKVPEDHRAGRQSPHARLRAMMAVYYRKAKGTGVGFNSWHDAAIESLTETYWQKIQKIEKDNGEDK